MITFPNAKINLGLNIVSRRPDGYHNLVSVFYPLPWHDILEIVPAQGTETTLTVTGNPCDCPSEKNLVMKAYRALDEKYGPLPPVDIYLRKIIPDGAGLGGGSAEAAFTLKMLNEFATLNLSDNQLSEIAASIGADCSFFIYNRPMLATGIGTDLTPVDISLEGLYIVVVKPPVHVSTAEAYSKVIPAEPAEPLPGLLQRPIEDWKDNVVNDFELSVFQAHPELSAIKLKLYDAGAIYASMSGSGSAVFGLFTKPVELTFPDCQVKAAPLPPKA